MTQIDWKEQWKQFSPYFREDKAVIPLSDFGFSSQETVDLLPGPGFGDLSHPTTHLVLSQMGPYIAGKTVIDLGCGSGVLGLIALKMGAKKVIAIDIDPNSLTHAFENAKLNGLESHIKFFTSLDANMINSNATLLMNMTFQDQKDALKTFNPQELIFSYWITSGILMQQAEAYLHWLSFFSISLIQSKTHDIWQGFCFHKK